MQTSPERVAFYKRRRPTGFKEILGYEQTLRDFIREMAQTSGRTQMETVDFMEGCGILHPLEAAFVRGHLDVWGAL